MSELSECKQAIHGVHEEIRELGHIIDTIDDRLFRTGDGRPPLMERVANMELRLDSIDITLQARRVEVRQIRLAIIVAGFAAIGHIIQLLPIWERH